MNNNGVKNGGRKPEAILESEVDERSIPVTVPVKKTSADIETASRRISVDDVFGMQNAKSTINAMLINDKKPKEVTCRAGRKTSTNGTSCEYMTAAEEEAAENRQTS